MIDRFLAFEEEHDLYDKSIKGVFYWCKIRFILQRQIAIEQWIVNKSHDGVSLSLSYAYHFIQRLWRAFWKSKHTDIYVFGHARRQKVDWVRTEIYTDELKTALRSHWYTIQDFEAMYRDNFSPLHGASKDILYLDSIEVLWTIISKLPILFTRDEFTQIMMLQQCINKEFWVSLNMRDIIKKIIWKDKVYTFFFKKLLRNNKPKCILQVWSYGILYQSLNQVAHELDIPTIELQHGTYSEYHLWYYYGENTVTHDMLPNFFLVFWDFWKDLMKIPELVAIQAVWYPYYNDRKKTYVGRPRNGNEILVISQWAIWNALYSFIIKLAKELPENYLLVYKLHPWEYARAKVIYPLLYKHKNIKVIGDETTIYELFGRCTYQVWVFSTAIYEGIWFGLRTILIDLPGISYMKKIIKDFSIPVVSSVDECLSLLWSQEQNAHYDSKKIFKEDAMQNIVSSIKKIIESK